MKITNRIGARKNENYAPLQLYNRYDVTCVLNLITGVQKNLHEGFSHKTASVLELLSELLFLRPKSTVNTHYHKPTR